MPEMAPADDIVAARNIGRTLSEHKPRSRLRQGQTKRIPEKQWRLAKV